MIKRVLVLTVVLLFIGFVGYTEAHYTRDVVVVEVQDQEVTVEDKQGNLWCFNGTDYTVDQEITVVMYDNHTGTMYDDEIVKVRSPT
jgi:hypothetical protein